MLKSFLKVIAAVSIFTLIIHLYQNSILIEFNGEIEDSVANTLFFWGIFIFLIYKQKSTFKNLSAHPSLLFGSLFLLISLILLYIGTLGSLLILEQVSFFLTIISIILLILGQKYLKSLILPILFMIVPFGIFDYILNSISIYLQVITAVISGSILNELGVVTVLSGPLMYMPHITLRVDPSCNGINHITALVVLALVLGAPKSKKILFFFIISAFVLGLFLNGLRVTLIGLWALFFAGDLLHGPGSIFYVTFIFITGSLVLIFIARQFRDEPVEERTDEYAKKTDPKKVYRAGILAIALLCMGGLFIKYVQPAPQHLKRSLDSIPLQIADFQGIDDVVKNSDYIVEEADDILNRLYFNTSCDSIRVYIAYLAKQAQNQEIVNYRNTGLYSRSRSVDLQSGDKVNTLRYINNGRAGLLYFWYVIDGSIYYSPTSAKLATLRTGLFKQKTNGALVVVWSNSKPQENSSVPKTDEQFLKILIPEIQKILQLEK